MKIMRKSFFFPRFSAFAFARCEANQRDREKKRVISKRIRSIESRATCFTPISRASRVL